MTALKKIVYSKCYNNNIFTQNMSLFVLLYSSMHIKLNKVKEQSFKRNNSNMIYSHSALSLHPWEDIEAERIWSFLYSPSFKLNEKIEMKWEKKAVLLPLIVLR